MKYNIKITILAIVAVLLVGCASDYLDTAPSSTIGTGTVFESTENAKLAINGMAKLMTRQYLSAQGYNGEGTIKMYYGNFPGNHFSVDRTGWSNTINGLYREDVTSRHNYYPWYYYYRIIGNANTLLGNIDDARGPQNEKEFLTAQALTYRAYSYMMLAQLYGYRWKDSNNGSTDGVVLRTDMSSDAMPLSTLLETYQQIYDDLDEAISLYKSSEIKRASDENYLPSIEVAYATYARAALNREDYPTAEKYAALARKDFPLMSVGEYNNGFSEPNKEWIWSCYGAVDETLYYYSYFAYMGYNSNASAVRNRPKRISRELYNSIPETDIRRNLFLDPLDDKYNTSNGRASTNSPLYNRAFEMRPDIYSTAKVAAYMQFKVKNQDNPGIGHLNLFRSSEMYLIEAEAQYFQNKETEAQNTLNRLTANSERDPEFNSTATGEELLAQIKKYRAIELWGEGFDWFDHKRWGDAIDRKSHDEGGNFFKAVAIRIEPDEGNRWTWRIPQRETDYNDAIGGGDD